MSQLYVERIIGVLATDEALRSRFIANPKATLLELAGRGMELTACELGSLVSLDPKELARFAQAIDARLQKADLQRGVT
ncbi:MAG TPA: Os1348 family NHLP clan protein [Candidatus Angelobacter sp.]|nr:Os1348 family NHLP clan protein [Candidatus Angelobacter sp.]